MIFLAILLIFIGLVSFWLVGANIGDEPGESVAMTVAIFFGVVFILVGGKYVMHVAYPKTRSIRYLRLEEIAENYIQETPESSTYLHEYLDEVEEHILSFGESK